MTKNKRERRTFTTELKHQMVQPYQIYFILRVYQVEVISRVYKVLYITLFKCYDLKR